ncbi:MULTISPECIES: helix-turn-helix domain-containing protein [Undibacterium]|jgi:transcriptional regulator with XRE-family HTH domain|uniref:Helix-turn-helix transcriptional regulator n=1 Tax=Undibacterium umbellatum TaxID=2762300 RepID=A0ABR6ZI65_9BURK|nr:helix-turn-helix transcriptional regulator [Undibacterium umbellatum]MBC3911400.1 helix-turn-helix transcriptional regulator [Undibacterium umbellatum]
MSTFGARLKEERKRVGMNQTEFAAVGGVLKGAQVNYEQDDRLPNAEYLTLISELGVDVMYLLKGSRVAASLDAIESDLLSGFRKLDQRGKAGVLALIAGMAPAEPKAKNIIHGSIGQVIEGNLTLESQSFSVGTKKNKVK